MEEIRDTKSKRAKRAFNEKLVFGSKFTHFGKKITIFCLKNDHFSIENVRYVFKYDIAFLFGRMI